MDTTLVSLSILSILLVINKTKNFIPNRIQRTFSVLKHKNKNGNAVNNIYHV